jgi:hypothetical protein
MGTIDASQCWRIMPFSRFDGSGNDWWILGPDHQPVNTGFVLTKEEAYGIALEHNKKYGVNAVNVHREYMRKGGWEQRTATPKTNATKPFINLNNTQ